MGIMVGLVAILMILLFIMAKFVGTNVRQDAALSSLGSCEEFDDESARYNCLRTLAIKNLDINPCLQIQKIPERDACLRNVAIKSKDNSICMQISTPDIRRMCSAEIG